MRTEGPNDVGRVEEEREVWCGVQARGDSNCRPHYSGGVFYSGLEIFVSDRTCFPP